MIDHTTPSSAVADPLHLPVNVSVEVAANAQLHIKSEKSKAILLFMLRIVDIECKGTQKNRPEQISMQKNLHIPKFCSTFVP